MYNHLTVCKQISSATFKNVIYELYIYKTFLCEVDLALNNLQ